MKLRKMFFWLHLTAGIVAGVVILVMSVTGVLLAFERQIVAFAERETRTVQPPVPGAPRLNLDTIVEQARATIHDVAPSGLILHADPATATMVNFGREQAVFIDPYTGAVRGHGATAVRGFFHVVTDWHRWLGRHGESRDFGRAVTGACNAAFIGLVVSGFYLWWPRRWTRQALRAVAVPSLTLRGKPRDWNWHNAFGLWSAPVLLFVTVTGLVISYQWAGNLIYTLTGTEVPPQRPPSNPPAGGGVMAGAAGGAPDLRARRQPRAGGTSEMGQQGRVE
ncbi:MAG TPA: PepSY-associated TM helix domain-containing protein, partial [Candidatus Tectomicrobia bacterium]